MISLIDVTRFHGTAKTPRIVLDNVSFRAEPQDRIGILAASGSGKSTLARIIAGSEQPDIGEVISSGRLSWPVGFASAFHPAMTPAENVALVAKLWNLDPYTVVARVEDFADLGRSFFQPTFELAPAKRVQLALALSLNTDFDMYLADDMSVSNSPLFREKCDAALEDKLCSAGLIMLTKHPRMLKQFAQRFIVLAGASLIECDNSEQAQDILEMLSKEEIA